MHPLLVLHSCLKDLESKMDQPSTLKFVERMSQQLESLDSVFKEQHYKLVDLINNDETLQKEQQILDDHNNEVTYLAILIQDLHSLTLRVQLLTKLL